MHVTLHAGTVTASATANTISGLLLPYGEIGHTSVGPFTVSAGAVDVPANPGSVHLNLQHDRARPIGKAARLIETPRGIEAVFSLAGTVTAADARAEVEAGLREGLSVELDDVSVSGGQLIYGRITAAALVTEPAFPSAIVTDETDETDETTAEAEPVYVSETTTAETIPGVGILSTQSTYTETLEEEEAMKLPATAAASAPVTAARPSMNVATLCTTLVNAQHDRRALAALSDIVPANILGVEQPDYIGELWDGRAYQRKIVPLFNHKPLTSYKVQGWKWKTKPAVAPWAGNKAAVPSASVLTERVEIDAKRIAGAHDIDRKFRDFNDEEFFAAYFAAMTESYAKVSDAQVLAEVIAGATAVVRGTVPANIAPGFVSIIDGALSVLNATDVMPTAAIVAVDLWRTMALTEAEKQLAFLDAALGLEEGTMSNFKILPSAALAAGKVLVANSNAVTIHELGDVPIRVEALDIARGGVDEGVFGYYAVNIHEKGGLALVSAA